MLLFHSHNATALATGLREGHQQRTDGVRDQTRSDLALARGSRHRSLRADLRPQPSGPHRGQILPIQCKPRNAVGIYRPCDISRWPVERTLEDKKNELGLSHFEVRKYHSIMRHLSVTQVSHLFLARQTQRLRGEKPGDHVVPGSSGCERAHRHIAVAEASSQRTTRKGIEQPSTNSGPEQARPTITHEEKAVTANATGHPPGSPALLHPPIMQQVALSY